MSRAAPGDEGFGHAGARELPADQRLYCPGHVPAVKSRQSLTAASTLPFHLRLARQAFVVRHLVIARAGRAITGLMATVSGPPVRCHPPPASEGRGILCGWQDSFQHRQTPYLMIARSLQCLFRAVVPTERLLTNATAGHDNIRSVHTRQPSDTSPVAGLH
jgi:hypothetical protein